jgi:hypothetical protein
MSDGAQDKVAENLSNLNKYHLNRLYVDVAKKFVSSVEPPITSSAIMINNTKLGVSLQM